MSRLRAGSRARGSFTRRLDRAQSALPNDVFLRNILR
jgi:hypothetical protein